PLFRPSVATVLLCDRRATAVPALLPPGPHSLSKGAGMTLIRTAGPAVEPVTLAGMKEHLRVTHDSEDALITDLIKAAREEVERSTSLALIEQTWRLSLDGWPPGRIVRLKRNPVVSVTSVMVYDEDGEGSLMPPEDYQL